MFDKLQGGQHLCGMPTPRRRPVGPGSRGKTKDGDELDARSKSEAAEDETAGRGVTRVLATVALVVVAIIGYRSWSASYSAVSTTNMNPTPKTPEEEAAEILVVERDEAALGINAEYPVAVLRDDNGTRSVKETEDETEAVRREEAKEEKTAHEYQDRLKERGEAVMMKTTASAPRSSPKRVASLGNLLFHDGAEYEAAPEIVLPPEAGQPFKGMWDLLVFHEELYKRIPHKRHVPRLAETISRRTFHQVFRVTSTPVIMSFEHVRALGFLTKAETVEELMKKHPYDPNSAAIAANIDAEAVAAGATTASYSSNSGRKTKLDLGPALYAISKDAKLEKIATGVRNFPRNLQLSSKNLATLDVSRPPFIQKKRFQPASMWFGTSTSDTKFHHDCCDNFVMMVAGTKRWFLAPVTDWRTLRPIRCEGDHQSLCWASLPYPNAKDLDERQTKILRQLNSVIIDLAPGEMLYLPAGWWHHIQNLGPTVMLNHWTFGCENVGAALEVDPSRHDRADFKSCPAAATAERVWREKMDVPFFGKDEAGAGANAVSKISRRARLIRR